MVFQIGKTLSKHVNFQCEIFNKYILDFNKAYVKMLFYKENVFKKYPMSLLLNNLFWQYHVATYFFMFEAFASSYITFSNLKKKRKLFQQQKIQK